MAYSLTVPMPDLSHSLLLALCLQRKYCRVQDRAMLVRFLRHLRDLSGVATQLVLDAYAAGSLDQRLEVMDLAVQAFQDAAKAPGKGGGKDYLFHAKVRGLLCGGCECGGWGRDS